MEKGKLNPKEKAIKDVLESAKRLEHALCNAELNGVAVDAHNISVSDPRSLQRAINNNELMSMPRATVTFKLKKLRNK